MVLPGFIVFEGLDGAGTTTQSRLLKEKMAAHGVTCHATCEPTGGPIGRMIRDVLAGRIVVEPGTLARLYAADRHEHLFGKEGVLEQTKTHRYVVSDRYHYSSLAYQGRLTPFDEVVSLNAGFPLPEYFFFLDVPVSACLKRLEGRPERDIFEQEEVLNEVAILYRRAIEHFSGEGKQVIIDGSQPAETIAETVWNTLFPADT